MTIEQAIAQYEQFKNVCEHHGLTASQEEFEQLAEWLRELQERRKADSKTKRGNARWLINSDGYYPYCSACMAEPEDGKMTDFCPSCGARMGEKSHEL